jgi:pimeloyl-ACP methyl ester carboxylesterase
LRSYSSSVKADPGFLGAPASRRHLPPGRRRSQDVDLWVEVKPLLLLRVDMERQANVHFGRFFRMILPAILILLVGVIVILGVMVYKISYPDPVQEAANPSYFSLPSLDVSVPTDDGKELAAWWIPGLKDAPAIILAAGYGMNRADSLSLAAALHESGFNLLAFDQRGNGAIPKGASTLGLLEIKDMLQAIKFVQARPDINPKRLGIWGTDVGAMSALRAAGECPEVRAIVADGAYESPADLLGYRIAEDFGVDNGLVHLGAYQIFKLAHITHRSMANTSIPATELSDRTILFIKGENRKGLAELTTAIYDKIQPQKEIISFKAARTHVMNGEDLKSYDRQVANFFHLNLVVPAGAESQDANKH